MGKKKIEKVAEGGRARRADSRYTRALGERICAQVANGATLTEIAGDLGLSLKTLWSWTERYEEFGERYREAQELQMRYMEDRVLVLCKQAHEVAAEAGEGRLRLDAIKLELDMHKWRLSKLLPGRYGDRSQLELTGKDGATLLPQHTREEDMEYLAMLAGIQEKTRRGEG